EPAASLDPEGQKQMMELFAKYHQNNETTTVLVTHHMEDAAKYADHIIVLRDGHVAMTGDRTTIFNQASRLREIGLELPASVRFLQRMKSEFDLTHTPPFFEVEEVAAFIEELVKEK